MSDGTDDGVTLEITADPERRFGHARLVLTGGVPGLRNGRFHLRRLDQEPAELGPRGWQNGSALLNADAVERVGDRTVLRVGPEVVDAIAVDTPVELELPDAGLRLRAWWPDIPPSPGRGSGGQIVRPAPPPGKAAAVAEGEPVPQAEPVATAAAPETGEPDTRPRRWPWLVAAGAAAVCLLAVAGYTVVDSCAFAQLGIAAEACANPDNPDSRDKTAERDQTTEQDEPETVRESAPAAGDPARRLEALLARDRAATGEELFALGQEALDGGDRNTGFDAVQEAVALGYGPALAQFARWYDPRYHAAEGSPFSHPNAATAIDYYRRAASAGTPESEGEVEGLCAYLRTEDGGAPLPSACAP